MNGSVFVGLVLVCGALLTPSIACADQLRVPEDYPTIADAAAAARPGDEIVLGEGVFPTYARFDIYQVGIRGAGPDKTVLVPDPAFSSNDMISWYLPKRQIQTDNALAYVKDLTISAYEGGDPSVPANYRDPLSFTWQFRPNDFYSGHFLLENVHVKDCYRPGGTGAYLNGLDRVTVRNCTFDSVTFEEGSVFAVANDIVVSGCRFLRNAGYAEPLRLASTRTTDVSDCLFAGTTSWWTNIIRGSIRVSGPDVLVRNCSFGQGGPDVEEPEGRHAHLTLHNATARFENCAFSDGVLYASRYQSTASFNKCVGPQIPVGNDNLRESPGFVDPGHPGADGVWRTDDDNLGDLTPLPGSPLIDAASGVHYTMASKDVLGNPRLVDVLDVPNSGGHPRPYLDIGAIEFQGGITCYADTNSDGLVTPADFGAWVSAFNAQSPACDQNGDGLCTPADFGAWIANFNAGCITG